MSNVPTASMFKRTSAQTDQGFAPAYEIQCSKCGHLEAMTLTNGRKKCPLPVEFIAQKFRDKGWKAGSRRAKDVCPKCQQPKEKTPMKNTPLTIVEPPKVEAPREPTRDQKRAIMEELSGSYDTKKQGYIGTISDHSIAHKLSVPRAWVAEIRDEFFGPAGDNEEARLIRREIEATKDTLLEAEKTLDKAVTLLSEIATKLQALEKRQEAIVKQLG